MEHMEQQPLFDDNRLYTRSQVIELTGIPRTSLKRYMENCEAQGWEIGVFSPLYGKRVYRGDVLNKLYNPTINK